MNILTLIPFVAILGQAAPVRDAVAKMPITESAVYGKLKTADALSFMKELVRASEKMTPGTAREAIAQSGSSDTYSVISNPKQVVVSWGALATVYSPATGRLLRFGFAQLSGDPKPNVSIDECVKRARAFYKLSGGAYELGEPLIIAGQGAGNEWSVNLTFEQFTPGEEHPVGRPIECIFDRTYGLPTIFTMSYPPRFERAARVQREFDAGQAAAAAGLQVTGWERVEVGAQPPRYVVPTYQAMPNAMSERHLRLSADRKACLVYEVSVNDSSSYNEEAKRYERFVQVYVDAETGQAIAVLPVYMMIGKVSTRKSQVVDDGIEWTCGKGKGKLTKSTAPAPTAGIAVELATAKGSWLFAKYDAQADLLYYGQDGETRVFTPDATLAKALRTYRPSPFAHQPKMTKPPTKMGSRAG